MTFSSKRMKYHVVDEQQKSVNYFAGLTEKLDTLDREFTALIEEIFAATIELKHRQKQESEKLSILKALSQGKDRHLSLFLWIF